VSYEQLIINKRGFLDSLTVGVWSVGHFEALSCQTATKFIKCNALEISTIRPM